MRKDPTKKDPMRKGAMKKDPMKDDKMGMKKDAPAPQPPPHGGHM